jgi:Flp pilus assembly protein TadD
LFVLQQPGFFVIPKRSGGICSFLQAGIELVMLTSRLAVLLPLFATVCLAVLWPDRRVNASGSEATADPDAACAQCHQAIFDRYRKTPMANASGPALDGLLTGGFTHPQSGIEYKVFVRDGQPVMSYQRPQPALSGERQLRYFIGSNHRGRTYLYSQAGLWFEIPINFYARKSVWDMAPNFGASTSMPDGLPVDPNCLHCHATGVLPSLASARNRYATVPFQQGGIGCAACHGDPAAHLAHPVAGNIANPAKLAVSPRDSVCLQCHLEGDAAIYKAGKSLADFKPGDDLPDYVNYFVKASAEEGGGRATSQWEALLRSACRQAVGDKLTCTTCHDPHGSPPAAERVAWFRGKCLACHTDPKLAATHHPEQQDCAVCHMPTRATTDISHEQTTDHNIQARPATTLLKLATLGQPAYRLVPVGAIQAQDRELGLAYAQAAIGGNRAALKPALESLLRAQASGASDAELHTQLGLLEQMTGQPQRALDEYNRALMQDPSDNTALGNKAILDASSGKVVEAIHLLERVLQNDPSQVSAALNLAFIECVEGRKSDARAALASALRFNPDDPALRTFLRSGSYAGKHCDLEPSPEKPTP